MKAGYCIGLVGNKVFFSPEYLMMEDFMAKFDIEESKDVIILQHKEMTEYFYKYLLLNINNILKDGTKDLRQIMFERQDKLFNDYKSAKPIIKEQLEMFQEAVQPSAVEVNVVKDSPTATPSTTQVHETMAKVVTPNVILDKHQEFLLAGRARFTLKNVDSGNRFTYHVKLAKQRKPRFGNEPTATKNYFVSVMTGTDNVRSYTYIGMLKYNEETKTKEFYLTAKSKMTKSHVQVKVFTWLVLNIDKLPSNVHFYHEGYCARCGRVLTVPESIKTGFGPECVKIRSKSKKTIGVS